jgi:anaerobic selenocysteine-containing dehydrogenase
MAEVRTYCRICSALCGIIVTTNGDTVESVRGNAEHPISKGYTCSKGRSLPGMLHHPDRLETPLRRGADGQLHAVSWDDALDGLAESIRSTIARRGASAVAAYRGTHWAFDCNGRAAAERFLRELGTHQIYSSVTIDTPNKTIVPDLMTGSPYLFPIPDWDATRLLIFIGQNPIVSHGHVAVRPDAVSALRAVQARGGRVVIVDPRITESARRADLHVRPRPGSDSALLAHLVRAVLDERPDTDYLAACSDGESVQRLRAAVDPFDAVATSRRTGVPEADLARLRDLVLASPRLSCVTGTGVSMGLVPNAGEWLAWALNAVTGSIDRPGGMFVNPGVLRPADAGLLMRERVTGPAPKSRPEFGHWYGELPTAVLNDEILAGEVSTLFVLGGNPMTTFPDTGQTARAFAELDELVVMDVQHTETTALATLVLPVAHQLERADLPLFSDGVYPVPFTHYGARAVAPGGQRRPMWWVFSSLAQRLGYRLPAAVVQAMSEVGSIAAEERLLALATSRSRISWEQIREEPAGIIDSTAPPPGWLVPALLPTGRIELCPPPLADQLAQWWNTPDPDGLLLLSRRLPRQMNSSLRDVDSMRHPGPLPTLLLSPADAARLGLADGDRIVVSTEAGETEAVLEVSPTMLAGTATLPHGWAMPRVNAVISNADLDALTGMPQLSGLPVQLRKLLKAHARVVS